MIKTRYDDMQELGQVLRNDAAKSSNIDMGEIHYPYMFGWMVTEAASTALDKRQLNDTIRGLRDEIKRLKGV